MSPKKMETTTVVADVVKRRPHDHRYPTRCKLRSWKAPYFPKEVIFNILVFVPADVLHEVARYVCKEWYDIVSDPIFVRMHREMSTPGFLVQDDKELHQVYHVEIVEAGGMPRLNTTEVPIPVSEITPVILCCLNGLVLLSDLTNKKILYVANPVTNVKITLPPLVGLRKIFESTGGLGVDSSGHYKVVHVSGRPAKLLNSKQVHMRVFTIGVDKSWRFLDLQGIPVNLESRESMLLRPYCLAGFIYWFTYQDNKTNSFGLAIDVDTETLYQFSHPQGVDKTNTSVWVVRMGTTLGFVQVCRYTWRLWKLTDVKSGEWTSLSNMNMILLYKQLDQKFGWVSNLWFRPIRLFGGYLWLYHYTGFRKEYVMVCYNLANESIVFFPTKIELYHRTLHHHENTLVSPRNC